MDWLRAGRALLLRGRQEGARHLWFVLTDPDPTTRQVVVVMLVTAQPHTDKTVTLQKGDHPFIRHESNVDYGTARFFPASKLEDALKNERAHLREDMSADLLQRVRAGLLASSRAIHDVRDHCKPKFEPKRKKKS